MPALIFDGPDTVHGWRPVNDAVMGGLSSSHLRYDPAGQASTFRLCLRCIGSY